MQLLERGCNTALRHMRRPGHAGRQRPLRAGGGLRLLWVTASGRCGSGLPPCRLGASAARSLVFHTAHRTSCHTGAHTARATQRSPRAEAHARGAAWRPWRPCRRVLSTLALPAARSLGVPHSTLGVPHSTPHKAPQILAQRVEHSRAWQRWQRWRGTGGALALRWRAATLRQRVAGAVAGLPRKAGAEHLPAHCVEQMELLGAAGAGGGSDSGEGPRAARAPDSGASGRQRTRTVDQRESTGAAGRCRGAARVSRSVCGMVVRFVSRNTLTRCIPIRIH